MRYAARMDRVEKSFIREILKVTLSHDTISFAGGLPNPEFFPIDAISAATEKVLRSDGRNALQYSTTEGYLPLREFIADRYYRDTPITAENILITTGSQQALDLISKVFIDPGDTIVIERPGYLGAIQAFSVYEPKLRSVRLGQDGVDLDELEAVLDEHDPKLFYAVPNFQNPTGLTYSPENREGISAIMRGRDTLLIEDNPYGELRFMGKPAAPMISYLGDSVLSLGSFSKVFAPSMRLGWVAAQPEIIDHLISLKQASDLHTNYFSQRVLHQYLADNDFDAHIAQIREGYKRQRDRMVGRLKAELPAGVSVTEPEGGMFLWLTLPAEMSSSELFEKALAEKVVFVPGVPFYDDVVEHNTLRLNYSNSSVDEIDRGVHALVKAMGDLS